MFRKTFPVTLAYSYFLETLLNLLIPWKILPLPKRPLQVLFP